ncbi:MAG: PAS domain S-box protein [Gammaproteobacteria bacterium]|nr:PAS domain S-box protein [Gammaproteobacteria bacterium]
MPRTSGSDFSRQTGNNGRALWIGLGVGVVVAIVILLLWLTLKRQEHEHVQKVAEVTARGVQALIVQDLHNRIASLGGLAQRWQHIGRPSQADWQADVGNIYAAQPGYQAIEWVDAAFRVRWIVPLQGNEAAADLDLRRFKETREAAVAARDGGKIVVTKPLRLVQGGEGIVAFVPLYRGETFDGFFIGVFRLRAWLSAVLNSVLVEEYAISLAMDGETVYAQDESKLEASSPWVGRGSFSLFERNWSIEVTPSRDFLRLVHTRFSTVALVSGLLLSCLTTLAVYQLLMARHRAADLKQTASRLQLLFENLPGMAYRCLNRPDWPMRFVSDGCKRLSGYDRQVLVREPERWGQLIHPDDREKVWQQVQAAVTGKQSFSVEYRITSADGEEKWLWGRGRAVVDTDGKDTLLEGFISDITHRKRAESALSEAQAYAEAIIDTAFEAVIVFDIEGRVERFNRSASHMFGYTGPDVCGRDAGMFLAAPFDKEYRRSFAQFIDSGKLDIRLSNHEVMCLRSDRSEFPAMLSVSEIEHQSARKFVCVIRDISLQRAAEHEASVHREQLAHVDRLNMLGEMASGIAHEINQPLTAISLFSQAGKRLFDSGHQERLPEIFDKLSLHAQRAAEVLQRVQTLARKSENYRELLDCRMLVESVAELAEVEAHIRRISIELDIEEDLPTLSVDKVQIQQVVLNLLRNGMQAMQAVEYRNGNAIRLKACLKQPGLVVIAVIDHGGGVSESIARDLFAPFSTTKESGMGMGLSISHAIVSAHGGQLDFFNNSSGGGATFWFSLPSAQALEEKQVFNHAG